MPVSEPEQCIISVDRSGSHCSDPITAITVTLECLGNFVTWRAISAIDENGEPVSLSQEEALFAEHMAAHGMDETGR